MIRKLVVLATFILLFTTVTKAQEEKPTKILNHEIGLQVNQLLHQLISFSDDNLLVENPYLITYSVFGNECIWGVQLGGGYYHKGTEDKFTAANHESKFNDIAYRAGIARYFKISKRWESTVGIDFAGRYIENKTVTFSVVDVSSSFTDSTASFAKSINNKIGGGFHLRFGYNLSEHISLSTEATLYYFTSSNKSNVLVAETVTNILNPDNDTYTLSSSNADVSETEFVMTIPIAIFLNISF